jgi:hypothetical protein
VSLHVTLALAHQDATFPALIEAACASSKGDTAVQLAGLCQTWLPAWRRNLTEGAVGLDMVPLMTLAADVRKAMPAPLQATHDDMWTWFSAHIGGALERAKGAEGEETASRADRGTNNVEHLRSLWEQAEWRDNVTDTVSACVCLHWAF